MTKEEILKAIKGLAKPKSNHVLTWKLAEFTNEYEDSSTGIITKRAITVIAQKTVRLKLNYRNLKLTKEIAIQSAAAKAAKPTPAKPIAAHDTWFEHTSDDDSLCVHKKDHALPDTDPDKRFYLQCFYGTGRTRDSKGRWAKGGFYIPKSELTFIEGYGTPSESVLTEDTINEEKIKDGLANARKKQAGSPTSTWLIPVGSIIDMK